MSSVLERDAARVATPSFDPLLLRGVCGQFPTGVTVITARAADGRRVGLTANSFSSLSLDPPLVLWSLTQSAPSRPDFVAASHFAIHVLAHDQIPLSRTFATPSPDKFAGLACDDGPEGTPLLGGAAARIVCRNIGQYDGGDHLIFIGHVMQLDRTEKAPLVFHAGRYGALAPHPDFSPGN